MRNVTIRKQKRTLERRRNGGMGKAGLKEESPALCNGSIKGTIWTLEGTGAAFRELMNRLLAEDMPTWQHHRRILFASLISTNRANKN